MRFRRLRDNPRVVGATWGARKTHRGSARGKPDKATRELTGKDSHVDFEASACERNKTMSWRTSKRRIDSDALTGRDTNRRHGGCVRLNISQLGGAGSQDKSSGGKFFRHAGVAALLLKQELEVDDRVLPPRLQRRAGMGRREKNRSNKSHSQ